MKVAFRTSNTIKHHVKTRDKTTDIYSLNGVYQMICKDCPLKYIGQTGHTFRTRYKERIREIKTNGQSSKFAQHRYDTQSQYYGTDHESVTYRKKRINAKCTRKLSHIYVDKTGIANE
jgi:hypothetical protein